MVPQWQTTTSKLQGHACLRHSITRELTAFGTKGLIFEIKPGELAAIRYSIEGDEVLIRGIPSKQVKTWATRLGIPLSGKLQLKLALTP